MEKQNQQIIQEEINNEERPSKSNKSFIANRWFLYILVPVLLGIFIPISIFMFSFFSKKYFSGSVPAPVPQQIRQHETSMQTKDIENWQTYRNEGPSPGTVLYPATDPQGEFGFEVKYPADVFAIVPVEAAVYPDFDVAHEGFKLIPAGQKERLGKKECGYGEAGFATVCNAASEDGISFMMIGEPLTYFTRFGDAGEGEKEVTIAGETGIVYSYGAEGYNTEHYYIPIKTTQTLVITVKSTYNWESKTRYPSKELVDQILSTFRFVK
ncbi:MAG: hypothetical protein AABX37_02810 [Nanoarchaeota archaeon]